MKKYLITGLTIVIILFMACKKNTDDYEILQEELTGLWIEKSRLSDTLIFNTISEGWLQLNRGKEIYNGYLLPKKGSGIYEYVIHENSISLYNLFSSCYCPEEYYFDIDRQREQITIGNFFVDSLARDELMTFKKIP